MSALTNINFWPTARHFAEAVQCPIVCFADPGLKTMLPAVDRLGMPLVTSGQFAYVFKLNPSGGGREGMLAVRCFRGFLGDREARYKALDAHLNAARIAALPRFKYFAKGILVDGRRFPALLMEWIEGPTLDVYLDEVCGRREVLLHLADEWLRLVSSLGAAGVAHGDLQHGNIIVERGQLRLIDLDGMYVPALLGYQASEVGHQHYQHPRREARHFSGEVDNFSALVIYLSLISLAERPSLWGEHHDENLLFMRADFLAPESSALFPKITELGPEHARLAAVLAKAAKADPEATPRLLDLVSVKTKLPGWMTAPAEVSIAGRTREVVRAELPPTAKQPEWRPARERSTPTTFSSNTVQTLFSAAPVNTPAAPPLDPTNIWGNTLRYAREPLGKSGASWWWGVVLLNIFVRLGAGFGATGFFVLFIFTLLVIASFLTYGYLHALRDAETASSATQLPGGTTSVFAAARNNRLIANQFASPPPLSAANRPASASNVVRNPVVGNRSLSIYHQPHCAWADKITVQHRANFNTPAAAQAAGYRPCRVCTP